MNENYQNSEVGYIQSMKNYLSSTSMPDEKKKRIETIIQNEEVKQRGEKLNELL